MKSYVATKKRKNDTRKEKFHVAADTIVEAAAIAENSIDSLWEIVKIKVMR